MRTATIAALLAVLAGLAVTAPSQVVATMPTTASAPASLPATKPARPEPPSVTLGNSQLEITILLPDPKEGFYRDARFDWSGIVGLAVTQSHTYFGSIRASGTGTPDARYSLGTSDEFKASLDTWADGTYGPKPQLATVPASGPASQPLEQPLRRIRIGVGAMEQRQETEGKRTRTVWKIVKPFDWDIIKGANFVEFSQDVSDGPWGYRYSKLVELSPSAASFTITRRFKNTGTAPIETMHYTHNWTRIDGQYIGKQYRLVFPFAPQPVNIREKDKAKLAKAIVGNTIWPGGAFWAELGPQPDAKHNEVRMENVTAGAGMKLTGDWKPDAFNIYVQPGECCPEPFIELKLKPGDERKWTSKYEFYTFEPEPLPQMDEQAQ